MSGAHGYPGFVEQLRDVPVWVIPSSAKEIVAPRSTGNGRADLTAQV